MKVFVTGATGFVGRNLVKALAENGEEITCLVRKIPEDLKGVKFVKGDINNKGVIESAIKDKDVVYHLVGVGNINSISNKDYLFFKKINVEGTRNIMDACLKYKIKKIIYLSSTASMGLIKKPLVNEEDKCNPKTPYQRSKYESEQLIKEYIQKYHLPVVTLRPTMIYGPGMKHGQILKIYNLMNKGFFPFVDSGKAIVPAVHVNDVVSAVIAAAKNGKLGETYIITSDDNKTLREIVEIIQRKGHLKIVKINLPKFILKILIFILQNLSLLIKINPPMTLQRLDSFTFNRMFDISKAKKELKWEPKISFEQGLDETIDYFKSIIT